MMMQLEWGRGGRKRDLGWGSLAAWDCFRCGGLSMNR